MSHKLENILSGESFKGTLTTEELKVRRTSAERYFQLFLESLGYDIENDSNMKDTPRRVVKMYMEEIARGTYESAPKVTVFPNSSKDRYTGVVFQGNCEVKSLCSHHLAFIRGKCHIAYIPKEVVVGLSKINRIVDWFSRRPQLQEQLTTQIHSYLSTLLETEDVAVYIEADHQCVSMRGVEQDSTMKTSKLTGAFLEEDSCRDEFYQMINTLRR